MAEFGILDTDTFDPNTCQQTRVGSASTTRMHLGTQLQHPERSSHYIEEAWPPYARAYGVDLSGRQPCQHVEDCTEVLFCSVDYQQTTALPVSRRARHSAVACGRRKEAEWRKLMLHRRRMQAYTHARLVPSRSALPHMRVRHSPTRSRRPEHSHGD